MRKSRLNALAILLSLLANHRHQGIRASQPLQTIDSDYGETALERYGPDERYFEALEDARRQKRGLWARENNVHPWEFKKQNYRDKQLNFITEFSEKPGCPVEGCNGYLVKRNGRFGAFFGCSNFPNCNYARSTAI